MGCKESTVKVHPDDDKNNNTNSNNELAGDKKNEIVSTDVSYHVTKSVLAANYNESRLSAINDYQKDKGRTNDNSGLQLNPNDKRNSVNKMGQYQCVESKLYKKSYDEQDREVINQYVLIETIGTGAYGSVYLCLNTHNSQFVAMKEVCKIKPKVLGFPGVKPPKPHESHEIEIWKQLNHPNIVKLIEVVIDEENDKTYLFNEYVDGGPIISCNFPVEPLKEENSKLYMFQIIKAVLYLHQHNIIHRDLKPDNILLTKKNVIKITDFGVSEICENGNDIFHDTVGTALFQSPETLTGEEYHAKKCDTYAIGIILYIFTFGSSPFNSDNIVDIYELIQNTEPNYFNRDSEAVVDLTKKLIEKDPQKRINLEQCLLHEWLISTKVDTFEDLPQNNIPYNIFNNNTNSQIKSDNNNNNSKFVKSIDLDEAEEDEDEDEGNNDIKQTENKDNQSNFIKLNHNGSNSKNGSSANRLPPIKDRISATLPEISSNPSNI